jgi:hypothetical protein
MTSFIQPLDVGIIRCFKAHYCCAFCECAIDLDKVGEDDIYKINLLKVMMMAKDAWDAISAEMICNCWNHTGIQQCMCHVYPSIPCSHHNFCSQNKPANLTPTPPTTPCNNAGAWDILKTYAMDESSLPEVEEKLQNHLGNHYSFADWKPVFDGIFNAEKDTEAALGVIDKLCNAGATSPLSSTSASAPTLNPNPIDSHPNLPQLTTLEIGLMKSVADLQTCK